MKIFQLKDCWQGRAINPRKQTFFKGRLSAALCPKQPLLKNFVLWNWMLINGFRKVIKVIFIVLGTLVVLPLILVLCIFIYTWIIQLQPEPISEIFSSACNSQFSDDYEVIYRKHRYYNAPMGIYYSEQGSFQISPERAAIVIRELENDDSYRIEVDEYVKFIVGEVRTSCKVNSVTGVISYTVTLR